MNRLSNLTFDFKSCFKRHLCKMFISLILLVLYCGVTTSESGPPSVCIEGSACYLGAWYHSIPNKVWFASFQGIRYAQPPIGKLRYYRILNLMW